MNSLNLAAASRGLAWLLAFAMSGALFAAHAETVLKVGRVVPVTGALAPCGKMTPWVDQHKLAYLKSQGGLQVGGESVRIEYKIYDSKSTVAGSGEAATRALLNDKVDVLMAQCTPDTTNAPADLCERYKTPCITSNTPVEAWLFGPDNKPKTYKYGFHFFFGVPDLVKNHIGMIKERPGGFRFNGRVGYLYPNDPDGVVFQSLFDPAFRQQGWTPVDPGRFTQGLPDFSAIINQFKRNRVQVVTGVLAPPDLQNYLQQAAQAGFRPQMYIIDKATGYPDAMLAIGDPGLNILSVNFWSPAYPGRSAFGGWSGGQLVQKFESANKGAYYTPTLGYEDASYDVLLDALRRAKSTKRSALLEALASTDLTTVVGRVKFNAQHYSVQPLGGAQWRKGQNGRLVKENVYSKVYPAVNKTATMRLYRQ